MTKEKATSVNRREDIIVAAIKVFSEIGYFRATTAQVAECASISQPYIYRFFTKESLLVEALEVSWKRIMQAFKRVIESASPEQLEHDFIKAYEDIMLAHRDEILLQMQAQTISDELVRQAMQNGISQVKQLVLDAFIQAGMTDAEKRASDFLARGMLCNISMALGMPDLMAK